ncbi:MAG: hypothetical protein ACYTFG_21685, partial [Planctomycetota bacterium]
MKTVPHILIALSLFFLLVPPALGESSDTRIPLKVGDTDLQMSGPYTFENLTLYPIHGKVVPKTTVILTLQEAL